MHGHSTKTNLFCYGPEYPRWSIFYLKSRAFAKIMQQADEMFSYTNSIFTISEHKKTTGRANMFLKHKIPYTYTFQLSNGFYETASKKLLPIDVNDMFRVGKLILTSFHSFIKMNAPASTISNSQHRRPDKSFMKRRSSSRLKESNLSYTSTFIKPEETIKTKLKKQKISLRTKQLRNTMVNT